GNATGTDVVATVNGNVLIPKASENPVYDLGGRLISTSLWNYTWNSEDRLIEVSSNTGIPACSLEFAYDHAGRRIKKTVKNNNTVVRENYYFYDTVLLNGQPADFGVLTGEKIINRETNETTNLQYLWGLDINGSYQGLGGNGGLLAVIDKTHSKVYLPCSDSKGTIHSYIDADTGDTVAKFAYDPYGRITSSSISSTYSLLPNAFSFTFQSKYYDSELQCYYFGFRYYDPATCRWLNRDPLGESGGLNLYAYCNNDPVNGMDYLGTVVILIHGVNTEADWFQLADKGFDDYWNNNNMQKQAVIHFKWGDTGTLAGTSRKQGGHPNYATDSVTGMYSSGYFSKERNYMERSVERLKYLIDTLNQIRDKEKSNEPITVIAHSQGSIITLGALQKGANIDNLIIMGSPLDIFPLNPKNNDLIKAKSNIRGKTYNYWSVKDEWAWAKGGIGAYGNDVGKIKELSWITNREFAPNAIVNGYTLPDTKYQHSSYMMEHDFFENIHAKDLPMSADFKLSNSPRIKFLKTSAEEW
ncbi:MAG: RHS repeat-associated core domain-containing protein, partial [Victivallales bacterium]